MESIAATNDWHLHLLGASNIINHTWKSHHGEEKVGALQLTKLSQDKRWLLRNFAYHDILMAIANDRAPLCTTEEFLQVSQNEPADAYFGVAAPVLEHLLNICSLNAENKAFYDASPVDSSLRHERESPDMAATEFEFIGLSFTLENKLMQWSCPDCSDSAVATLAEGYRSAALIFLFRTIRRRLPKLSTSLSEKIDLQVKQIVRLANKMPVGCLPECTLLFPLFMAGGEARQDTDIAAIRERMLTMNRTRRFKNTEMALSVLDEMWRLRMERQGELGAKPIDWLDVVNHRSILLSLS